MLSYEEALAWINRFQFHGYRLGLERMEAILKQLGSPELSYPSIHVAGTNGKGSVCAVCETIAKASGLKCGFYSSPHLFCLNERFRINGTPIEDEELTDLIFRIKNFLDRGYELSYFEYTTAIAMLWFMEQGVHMAVFETGLGGRLDATNVITPVCSVITNVSLEHQAWLGDSVEDIAREKSGIIKPGRPVVSGLPEGRARDVVLERAFEEGSKLFELNRDFHVDSVHNSDCFFDYKGIYQDLPCLRPSLKGSHQIQNSAVAIAAWEVFCRESESVDFVAYIVTEAVSRVKWPGRGEILSERPFIILDGAHNEAGVEALIHMLKDFREQGAMHPDKSVLLWACSDEGGDKDFVAMLENLKPLFTKVVITEPPGPRKPVTVVDWNSSIPVAWEAAMDEDWNKALNLALNLAGENGCLCVAGSLYLVGAVRQNISKIL